MASVILRVRNSIYIWKNTDRTNNLCFYSLVETKAAPSWSWPPAPMSQPIELGDAHI